MTNNGAIDWIGQWRRGRVRGSVASLSDQKDCERAGAFCSSRSGLFSAHGSWKNPCPRLILALSVRQTGSLWWAVGWHAAFDLGQLFLIGTRNGGQMPAGHLFEVSFLGPAWLNGGDLGTEASVFMVLVAIATFIYVIWFLRGRQSVDKR